MAEMIWNGAVTVYDFIMDNIVIINILFALIIVFFQRRSPQTVWTWLLLLYFIPILGFILYLVIGQDFHKSRMFKAKEIEGELKYAVRRQEETRKLLRDFGNGKKPTKRERKARDCLAVTPLGVCYRSINSSKKRRKRNISK